MRPVWAEFESCIERCDGLEVIKVISPRESISEQEHNALLDNLFTRYRNLVNIEYIEVKDEHLSDSPAERRQILYRSKSQSLALLSTVTECNADSILGGIKNIAADSVRRPSPAVRENQLYLYSLTPTQCRCFLTSWLPIGDFWNPV
jgi:hypothetical protein